MSKDNVIQFQPKPSDLELGSTPAAPRPATSPPTAPKTRRISVAPDTTIARMEDPTWWANVQLTIGKLAPGDTVYVDRDDDRKRGPQPWAAMVCEKITEAGPVMTHKRLKAEIIPAEPIDAVMAFLKSARSPLTIADLAIMAGLTSRKERFIVKAIEALGWEEPWPPEFSVLERNRRIIGMAKDICTAAGESTNEAPRGPTVKRFFRAIAEVAPRRRTERK